MNDDLNPDEPLGRAVDLLRAPVPIASGLEVRAVAGQRHRRNRRISRGIALVLLVGIIGTVTRQRASGTSVTFSIAAPSGQSVALVGDFTDWRSDRVQLQRTSSGLWHATVTLLPGRYRFAYVVDHNQWRADSSATVAPDDFGRPTSVLTVAGN